MVSCDEMELKGIRISVVVPIYNVSPYVERCIRSIMNQSFPEFECILVDDASPDDSIEKCERIIVEFDGPIRFKIIHHEKNRGLSAARNTGTDAAKGDYILYVDSDDEIACNCIEKLAEPVMLDDTIEMVQGNEQIVTFSDENTSLLKTFECHESVDYKDRNSIRKHFFERNGKSHYAWNRLIRKDFLIRNNLFFKEGLLWEDDLWLFFVMKHVEHLYVIGDVTYFYYIHPYSITTNTDLKTRQHHWGVIYSNISNNFTPGDSLREVKYYIRGFCKYYIDCSQNNLYRQAYRNFKDAASIKNAPVEHLFLIATGLLSKIWIGRIAYHGMMKVYKSVRSLFRRGQLVK